MNKQQIIERNQKINMGDAIIASYRRPTLSEKVEALIERVKYAIEAQPKDHHFEYAKAAILAAYSLGEDTAPPWTYIMTDAAGEVVAETLPERHKKVLFCATNKNGYKRVYSGSWSGHVWYIDNQHTVETLESYMAVYAWQPWPSPAIYGGDG